MENHNIRSELMMAQTPKYSKTKPTELKDEFNDTEMIYKREERLQSNSKKTEIFDQILKSLETPRVTSSNPYDLKQASKGKVRSRMGELASFKNGKNGIGNAKNLIINGSKVTKFSKLARNYSNFGSRVSSPSKKRFEFQGMKTPSLRSQRDSGLVFRDITNANMTARGDDLEMITSAMPERKRRVYPDNGNEFQEFSKSKQPNFFSQANDFSSKSQLKYLPKIPKIEFEEEEDHQFANISSNFGRANVPKFNDDEFQAWEEEARLEKASLDEFYNKRRMIGKKRARPEYGSFEFEGRKKVKTDMYSIPKNHTFARRRSGVRSTMPERYKEEFKPPVSYDDFGMASASSKNCYSIDSDFEMERMKLKQRYQKESRMLMERARKHKMMKNSQFSAMEGFKKPKSKKSKRGAARPPVIKEGDWLCPNQNCCNINWSKRVHCNLCHTTRPHMSAVKRRPYMITKLYEANTWSCPKCKNIINAAHTFCGICGTTRTKDIEQGLEQVKRHYAQKKNSKSMAQHQSPSKLVKMEDTDNSYSSISKNNKEARAILDDPYNDGLLELNLRRNFGPDYLASGNWYRSSEVKR